MTFYLSALVVWESKVGLPEGSIDERMWFGGNQLCVNAWISSKILIQLLRSEIGKASYIYA
jgi:hypothetical protein